MSKVQCGRNGCEEEADGGFFDQDVSSEETMTRAMAFRAGLCKACSKEVADLLQRPKNGRGPGWAN